MGLCGFCGGVGSGGVFVFWFGSGGVLCLVGRGVGVVDGSDDVEYVLL